MKGTGRREHHAITEAMVQQISDSVILFQSLFCFRSRNRLALFRSAMRQLLSIGVHTCMEVSWRFDQA
jgi:hypothetical protein